MRFAAKEAVSKALGTGFSNNIGFIDIEVTKNKDGKPSVVLHNNAKNVFNTRELDSIEITLSHCREYAVASALAYSNKNN